MRFTRPVLFVLLAVSARAQTVLDTDTCGSSTATENIYNYRAFGDSLSSSFVITIKKKVAPHKHLHHSEHVLVLEGRGEMILGQKNFRIKKGDLIFIPQNTVHAVNTIGK